MTDAAAKIEQLEKEIAAIKEQIGDIQRGFVNLRAMVQTSNLRGATRRIVADINLVEPVHNCGNPDCDGQGHSKSRLGELLPCRAAWMEEMHRYHQSIKMKPKPRTKQK